MKEATKECPHITLNRQNVGNFRWYACNVCGEKFQATEWNGAVKVSYPQANETNG